MNKTVILLFLAVFAVYQVQGYSLYDRLFQDEERDLDPVEEIMRWSSGVEQKRGPSCTDISPGYCRRFSDQCKDEATGFISRANSIKFRMQLCCLTCSSYDQRELKRWRRQTGTSAK